jgi:ribosomal protein S18 acetylase RimI-like enzyme
MSEFSSKIRRATAADAAALAGIAGLTFAETFAPHNTAEDLALYLAEAYGEAQQRAELENPRYLTLVVDAPAGHDTPFLAYAQLRVLETPDCVTGAEPVELYRFYLASSWHGKGLAQQLMAATRAAATQEFGGKTLWLGVWEKNGRAIAFYRKCGFQDVGSHGFLVGTDLQTDRIMVTGLEENRLPSPPRSAL